ncbi:restriction endonuclease subunit S [Aequorivita sediminis]|uniref:restriction endonuclease subunit S n=1 Tax=Aequorivita sediminis TaxID=3073653 RepID=UPI0028B1D910|nr:restriction endonuclease subunit S [Aequorivita sp. F6058]
MQNENKLGSIERSRNVPQLRFSEFEGDWEKKKLKNVAEIITGSTPSTTVTEFYNGDKLFVSPADIQLNRYVETTKTTLTHLGFSKGRKVKKGSVLFVSIGSTIGKVGQVKEDVITNQQINSLVSKSDFSDDFIYSLLEKNGKRIKHLSGVQAVPLINKTDFSELKFNFPSFPEQQKIATFLTAIDSRLQSLEKKKSLLEEYKKGLMQQIFKQEIRFKDDEGNAFPEWEFKKGNLLFKSVSDKDHNSDLPILAITQDQGAIPRDQINYNIGVTEKSVSSYKVVQIGDFIISLRSFQGGIEYSNYRGICSPAYIILRPIKEMERDFYKYYLKTPSYIGQLVSKLEGIRDGKMVSYKYFSEIKLPYPSLEEQTKIADFLSAIDDKINLVGQQIEQTKTYKKGLLQKMFV